jgi:hypothetical protein
MDDSALPHVLDRARPASPMPGQKAYEKLLVVFAA